MRTGYRNCVLNILIYTMEWKYKRRQQGIKIMFATRSFINELQRRYPAPQGSKTQFDLKDIREFERKIGAEMPSDFYDFLRVYGYGSFNDYFYVWNPFIENGANVFLAQCNQAKENYEYLENKQNLSKCIDCKFSGNELIVLRGNQRYVEFLGVEHIDEYTRSKIVALGDHWPYRIFPKTEGIIYFGKTNDDDFFVRIQGRKTSVIMYGDRYYEFDMGITEFIFGYLTKTIKLPRVIENMEWNFISYEKNKNNENNS